jgi:hypothetical protein
MRNIERIAYKGIHFTIEWYFDEHGKSQPFDYVMNLSDEMQEKVFYLFKRIADFGRISDVTKFRHEGDQIYAFKPQPDRLLSFFIKGKVIIITNAFRKKTDKLPEKEKRRAINCRESYLDRVKEGEYYEKEES